jgi:hypothetical protein
MKSAFLVLVVGVVLVSATGRSGENGAKSTELARAAAAMKVGEWRELKTEGMSRGLIYHVNGKNGSTPNTVYTNRLNWDPITRTIPYIGAGHGRPHKFIMYSEKTNAWTTIREMPKGISGGHSYCTATVNKEGALFYQLHARAWDQHRNLLFRYDLREKKWTTEQIPKGYNVNPGHCLTYFEPLNALVQFKGRLGMYDLKTKKWSGIPARFIPTSIKEKNGFGTLEHVMAVSRPHKLVVFGGGSYGWRGGALPSKVLYQMDAAKKVERLPDAPVGVRVTKATMSADPVTGDILVTSGGEIYSLDLEKKKWTHHEDRKPPFKGQNLATPVSTYGVSLFFSPHQLKVYLYKHAEKKKS